ncbi:hypothetical protein ABMA28_014571 [Loxostege sticticalis]|uniref:Integrase catalytic domain-containing protein n=1 Tax=Loxostege sticticalis TaxID=481309 RepID=A0ABD0THB0_LOXSC
MEVNQGQHVGVKLLGSQNWNVWKFQTTVLLRSQMLLDIVEGLTIKPKADDPLLTQWQSKDAKAQALIVTRMSEDVMVHLLTCKTAAEMWRKLASVYEQKSETSRHIVQQRFFQYKYEPKTGMAVFLSKLQEMQNQLKQLGEEVSDQFVITKVLMSLPNDYRHFVSAWESAAAENQTFDNLAARLLIEEERLQSREVTTTNEQSEAFAVKRIDKKNVKCFKCNKLGHYKSDKTTKTCQIIHADVCGPMEEQSVGGSKYFLLLKDDYSNYRVVYFVKRKDEVKGCIKDFLNKSENITGNKVQILRSDNGLEFVNREMKEMLRKRGITHQTTVAYTPEQNGKAERENRTLVEAARTMLCARKLPKKLWAEAVNTAAYVLNRTGKSQVQGKTPYEI